VHSGFLVILNIEAICANPGQCTVAWGKGDANISMLDWHDFQAKIAVFEPQRSVLERVFFDAGATVQESYADRATAVPHSALRKGEMKH
jgi:hypothetical protein